MEQNTLRAYLRSQLGMRSEFRVFPSVLDQLGEMGLGHNLLLGRHIPRNVEGAGGFSGILVERKGVKSHTAHVKWDLFYLHPVAHERFPAGAVFAQEGVQ